MLFSKIGILDETLQYREDYYVATEGDCITYIGAEPPPFEAGEVYNGKGKLLMTGLINTHSHAPMTLLRGYAENMTLQSWLNDRVFPFEAKMQPEDIYNGSMLAFAEMLRFGVVSTSEMYYQGEAMGQAVEDSGIRSNISLSVTCFDDRDLRQLPIYQEVNGLLPTLHHSCNDRLRIDLSLHAEYTSNPKIAAQMAEWAAETGLITQIHLSETRVEQEECLRRHGKTPAAYFAALGLFDHPVIAAHNVWLTPEDRRILAEKGVFAATNPTSNLKLASGYCLVQSLIRDGVTVTLGTDGAASNNSLNLWNDLKLMAILTKAAEQDPTAISPKEALKIATSNGASAQGRGDCGALKVGNKADLLVMNLDVPWMHPIHSIENQLLFAAQGSDVVLTMVDGVICYRDGTYPTIDIERVIYNAQQSTHRILQEC